MTRPVSAPRVFPFILQTSCSALVWLGMAAAALAAAGPEAPERTAEQILKTVTLPPGFDATVFAKAPQGGYPTSVSAAPDGTIFVAVDENGSLDRKPGRGRVLRMRDTDGDGKADESVVFAEMDSPRGVIWDGASGTGPGTLYVMHPPNLTAYTDTDGDGKADKQEDLVTGLGFDLNFRGADHTTNGARLAIDGYIYVAVGDYGYVEAKGKDGKLIKNRGGGIVRVHPDGTGLEIVSRGQRNIYDVAVSPTLDIFTRDNTNDGGGWNVRLSYVPPGAHMGYPYYFRNFPEDMYPALVDYGGGSPCGALWADEQGFDKGLYTVEWGRNAIMYHPLERQGAGFGLVGPGPGQVEWLKLTRPTDMDVDALGHAYITSWEGATFNYNGPFAGYILRVGKKDAPATKAPDFAALRTPAELAELLSSPSGVIRQAAQRELLRRKDCANAVPTLEELAKAQDAAIEARVAALCTLTLIQKKAAAPTLVALAEKPELREYAIAMLGDLGQQVGALSEPVLITALTDPNPRVAAAAIIAIRRQNLAAAAPNLLPLTASADPVLSHLSVRALSELRATKFCLDALDSSDEKVKPGALKALYGIHEMEAVDGILARLPEAKGELRQQMLNALCRLANVDATYVDPKVWWGTRPDTSGPVYQPERWAASDKIEAALKTALGDANEEEEKWLITRMYATKVNFPGLVELMLEKAGGDTPARLTAVEGMYRADNSLPPEAVKVLVEIAGDENEAPELQAKALRLLQKGAENPTVFPGAVEAFAPLAGHDLAQKPITAAFEDFTHDAKNGKWVGDYTKMLGGDDAPKRTLAATVLVNLAAGRVGRENERTAAKNAVEKGVAKPEQAAAILGAIARAKAKPFAELVKAHLKDPNNAVAESALYAYQALGLKEGEQQPVIGGMKYEDVAKAVATGGDVAVGQGMFLRAGCIACHTLSESEPPKGPILSAVAKIYDRPALIESILKPSAKIAQGFESQWFLTKKGEQIEGFVTREGADSLDVRNIAGQTVTLEKGDISGRGKREQSMMPEGLMNSFTPAEMAALLAYLESLKK